MRLERVTRLLSLFGMQTTYRTVCERSVDETLNGFQTCLLHTDGVRGIVDPHREMSVRQKWIHEPVACSNVFEFTNVDQREW